MSYKNMHIIVELTTSILNAIVAMLLYECKLYS